MNLAEIAQPRRWTINNHSARGGRLTIAGWCFDSAAPDAPVMLLHHANGLCGAPWALVAAQLAGAYRVYALDARGHGDSDALIVPQDYSWDYFIDDLVQVARCILSETGAADIALGVGSSFGGIITAAASARAPELFRRVVMLDPPIHPSEELLAALGMAGAVAPSSEREGLVAQTLKRRKVWPSRHAARQAWRDKPLFAAWAPEAFELYLQHCLGEVEGGQVELRCDPALEAHIFQSTGSLGVLDYAPQVAVPVKVVHAAEGFFPQPVFRRISTLFRDGEFLQLAGGHMLPLEVPELVAQLLLSEIP